VTTENDFTIDMVGRMRRYAYAIADSVCRKLQMMNRVHHQNIESARQRGDEWLNKVPYFAQEPRTIHWQDLTRELATYVTGLGDVLDLNLSVDYEPMGELDECMRRARMSPTQGAWGKHSFFMQELDGRLMLVSMYTPVWIEPIPGDREIVITLATNGYVVDRPALMMDGREVVVAGTAEELFRALRDSCPDEAE